MAKNIISEDELRDWINAKMHEHDECQKCEVRGIMKLRELDESGCNWSYPTVRCSGQPADICKEIAGQIINEARSRFNLA